MFLGRQGRGRTIRNWVVEFGASLVELETNYPARSAIGVPTPILAFGPFNPRAAPTFLLPAAPIRSTIFERAVRCRGARVGIRRSASRRCGYSLFLVGRPRGRRISCGFGGFDARVGVGARPLTMVQNAGDSESGNVIWSHK